jgi:hypothetical protein
MRTVIFAWQKENNKESDFLPAATREGIRSPHNADRSAAAYAFVPACTSRLRVPPACVYLPSLSLCVLPQVRFVRAPKRDFLQCFVSRPAQFSGTICRHNFGHLSAKTMFAVHFVHKYFLSVHRSDRQLPTFMKRDSGFVWGGAAGEWACAGGRVGVSGEWACAGGRVGRNSSGQS